MTKKQYGLTLLLLLGSLGATAQPAGWATVDRMTNGAGGASPVTVTNFKELKKALAKNDTTPRTIYLKGRIVVPKLLTVTGNKNKSVIGLPGAALVNDRYTLAKDSTGILKLDNCENMVLQNITFLGPGAFDRDANDNLLLSRSHHVWVDHCDFQDGMDGNLDCNHGSDYITVSWCRFRYLKDPWPKLADDENDDHNSDHRFSNLWGSSDREGAHSEGKLRTTFVNCWWDEGCRARMPFVRFAQVHLLNCLYSSPVATVYVQARYKSNVLAENCVFTNKPEGIKVFQTPSKKSLLRDFNIRLRGCIGADDVEQRYGEADYFTPPYPYTATPAAETEQKVKAGAGATMSIKQ